MRTRYLHAALFLTIFGVIGLSVVMADEVVMSSGERFSSSMVWEEDGKIRFNMQGLMVSVDKAEVTAVIRSKSQPKASNESFRSAMEDHPPPESVMQSSAGSVPPTAGAASETGASSAQPRKKTSTPMKAVKTDPGTGFQGVNWLMTPVQIPGLKKIETDPAFGGIDQYWRPDQELIFGKFVLDGWVYGFWEGQLYSIMMWTNGPAGYEALRQEVLLRYGNGIQSKTQADRLVWDGPQTQRMLEFDPKLKTVIFTMRSTELDARIKERYR